VVDRSVGLALAAWGFYVSSIGPASAAEPAFRYSAPIAIGAPAPFVQIALAPRA
jgi:hypothetical protein